MLVHLAVRTVLSVTPSVGTSRGSPMLSSTARYGPRWRRHYAGSVRGETDQERRQGLTFTTVEGQCGRARPGVPAETMMWVVLAYEPVWAIGTGVNATPIQAAEGRIPARPPL